MKKSLLVICEILGLFVNTLSADDKYCLVNRDNLLQHIQTLLSQKQKTVSRFFCHFGNLDLILKIFKKKMTFIADVVFSLRTPKNVVR